MINRNKYSDIVKDISTGNRYYENIYFPYVRDEIIDFYIYSVEGDSLDKLSKEYYQDENYWIILASVNNLSGMNVKGGIQLKIPNLKLYLDEFKKVNQ